MIIHSKLFSECKAQLFTEIEKGLGIHEADGKSSNLVLREITLSRRLLICILVLASYRCLQLMADDPERLERREFLLKEQEKLELALTWLSCGVNYSASNDDEDVDMTHDQETYIKSAGDD